MFSEKELNLEEHELREAARTLPAGLKHQYQLLELRYLKRPATYTRLNWVFPLGLHHFYLGRWVRGSLNLSLSATGLWLMAASDLQAYGGMILLLVLVIDIPQLLNARHLVHSHNNRIMERCLKQVSKQSGRRKTNLSGEVN
jgi:TM2 domain-containing membrane protein YozV